MRTFYIVNQHLCWYTSIHTHPHLKLDYEISHSVHTAFWCSTPFHSLNNASYNLPNQSLCPPGEPGSGPCQAFPVGLNKLPAMAVVPTSVFAGMADEAEQAITTAISKLTRGVGGFNNLG